MIPILLEGGNPDLFKRYLLTLLQEDTQFKQELVGILLQGSVLSPVKSSRKGAKKGMFHLVGKVVYTFSVKGANKSTFQS